MSPVRLKDTLQLTLSVLALFCLSAPAQADLTNSINTNSEFISRHETANAAAAVGDYESAVPIWRELSEAGFARSQHNLGNSYYNGWIIKQDKQKALEWYQRAAEQGIAMSQMRLCYFYLTGEIVAVDYDKAYSLCLKSSEQGLAEAERLLGHIYKNGAGVTQDLELAADWFQKAAEQGDANAQFELGLSYINGWGVEKDDTLAFRWYLSAAKSGHSGAQVELARSYELGRGTRRNTKTAVEWYFKAAEQGDAVGQGIVGSLYMGGQYVKKDYTKALEWLSASADQGNDSAQNNLGIMYESAMGVRRDPDKAFRLFMSAAEKGNSNSQFLLGYMYLTGKHVSPDINKAVHYLQLADEGGHKLAAEKLPAAKRMLEEHRLAIAAQEEEAQRPVRYLKQAMPTAVALAEAAAQAIVDGSSGPICKRFGIETGSELLWSPYTATPKASLYDVKSAWDYVSCIGNIIGLHNVALKIIDLDAAKRAGFVYYPEHVIAMVEQSCDGPWGLPKSEQTREGYFDGRLAEVTLGACVSAQVQAMDHITQYWK